MRNAQKHVEYDELFLLIQITHTKYEWLITNDIYKIDGSIHGASRAKVSLGHTSTLNIAVCSWVIANLPWSWGEIPATFSSI